MIIRKSVVSELFLVTDRVSPEIYRNATGLPAPILPRTSQTPVTLKITL